MSSFCIFKVHSSKNKNKSPFMPLFSSLGSFKNFDLEDSLKCSVDWLMIGPSSKREEYRVCGSSIPPSFISARDHIWIFFHSDPSSSGQAQGFRLSYIRGKRCSVLMSLLVAQCCFFANLAVRPSLFSLVMFLCEMHIWGYPSQSLQRYLET